LNSEDDDDNDLSKFVDEVDGSDKERSPYASGGKARLTLVSPGKNLLEKINE
jgi:hypothetical protein